MSLEFSNLPLEQVVCRAVFQNPVQIDFASFTDIWSTLKVSLGMDKVEELTMLDNPIPNQFPQIINRIPGLRFINEKNGVNLLIQNNVVLAYWDISTNRPYPRFTELKIALLKVLDVISVALRIEPIPVAFVNMTYANLIVPRASYNWPFDYLKKLVSPSVLPAIITGNHFHELNLSWRNDLENDIRIIIQHRKLDMGKTTVDGKEEELNRPAYGFTTVSGRFIGQDSVETSLNAVHEDLLGLFSSCITEEAKIEWGFKA